MKFTVSSSALNSQLQNLSKVINSKNTLAILDCFLFDVKESKLTITASDSENMMKSSISLESSDMEGKFAIVNRTILDAMKELPEQPLTFDVNMEDFKVDVHYQNGSYQFTAQDGEEYPYFEPIGSNCNVITINEGLLASNLTRSLFATASDELRPVMNGIYFDQRENYLAIVASDGHKLVRNKNLEVKSSSACSFIIPKKPATLLKNAMSKADATVEVKFNESKAEITFEEGTLSCRLIEGKYPKYESVIPTNNPNEIIIDRKGLLSALKRVLPFASESSELIRFNIEAGKIQLISEDIDFSTSAQEALICDYSGMGMSIGFKGSSLLEILNNLSCNEITISLADPSRAGIITPTTQLENENVLMLLMPMLLNE